MTGGHADRPDRRAARRAAPRVRPRPPAVGAVPRPARPTSSAATSGGRCRAGGRSPTLIAEALPATAQIAVAGAAPGDRRRRGDRPRRHDRAQPVAAPAAARAAAARRRDPVVLARACCCCNSSRSTGRWFPALGNEGWRSIVLPAITLAVPTGALIAQVLAKSLQHHARTSPTSTPPGPRAPAAGACTCATPCATPPLPALTMAGLIVGALLSGSVVIETVFSRTGLGRLTAVGGERPGHPGRAGPRAVRRRRLRRRQPRRRPALPGARSAHRPRRSRAVAADPTSGDRRRAGMSVDDRRHGARRRSRRCGAP